MDEHREDERPTAVAVVAVGQAAAALDKQPQPEPDTSSLPGGADLPALQAAAATPPPGRPSEDAAAASDEDEDVGSSAAGLGAEQALPLSLEGQAAVRKQVLAGRERTRMEARAQQTLLRAALGSWEMMMVVVMKQWWDPH